MAQEVIDRLTSEELLVLAGLLRKLVRADGQFTPAEREAIARAATQLAVDEGEPVGDEKMYALLDQAGDAYPDDEALRAAAVSITRPEARAAMHAHLFDVAASDAISKGESDLLDWLEKEWDLEIGELQGENTEVT